MRVGRALEKTVNTYVHWAGKKNWSAVCAALPHSTPLPTCPPTRNCAGRLRSPPVGGPLLFARGGAARVASRLILLVPTQAPTTFCLCRRQPGRRPLTAPRQETRPKGPRLSTRVLHVVVKFLKHGAPLYHRSASLATATTFRPFQEKQFRRQRPAIPGSYSSQLFAALGIKYSYRNRIFTPDYLIPLR